MASTYGGSYLDVQKRVAMTPITATSAPSSADVDAWVVEGEAKLNNTLKSVGIGTPITDTEGKAQLKSLSVDYAEGRLRRAHAPAGGDAYDDGQKLLDAFDAVLADIRSNAAAWSAMLGGGTSEAATRRLRSHVTNDVDGRTRDRMGPTFVMEDGGDQF